MRQSGKKRFPFPILGGGAYRLLGSEKQKTSIYFKQVRNVLVANKNKEFIFLLFIIQRQNH